MRQIDEQHALEQLVARLHERYPEVPLATVRQAVSAAHLELAEARIRAFVPILVENQAVAVLRSWSSGGAG